MDIYALPVPGSGGKTCSQIFEEAGCDVPASPSCAACLGGPRDTYARMNEPQASLVIICAAFLAYERFERKKKKKVEYPWFLCAGLHLYDK